MMDIKEVKDRVVKVTCDILGCEPSAVKDESTFVGDLGAESTQSVQLVAAFEEEFDIEMDGEAALQVQNVADAIRFIKIYVDKK
jgi:acyl carrier protein